MSDTLEPVITLEELSSRQEQMQNAIGNRAVNENPRQNGITFERSRSGGDGVLYMRVLG